MNIHYRFIKIILSLFLLVSFSACAETVKLTQTEMQIYTGQNFEPRDFLSDTLLNNQDIEISNGVNTDIPGEYEVTYTLGGSKAVLKVEVLKDPITLILQNAIIETRSTFNPKEFISIEDRTIDIRIDSNVDPNKAGDYIVVYSYFSLEKVLNVQVRDLEINLPQSSISIDLGSGFDPKDYITSNFPASSNLSIQNNVDTNKIGKYQVTYETETSSLVLDVNVKDVSPILTTSSASIRQGSTFDPISYLVTEDRNNKDIIIDNKVNTSVPGSYQVTYRLGEVVKTLAVTVTRTTTTTTTQPTNPTVSTSYTLKVLSLTSPVSPNENATIKVQGKAGKQYTITVYYKSGPSKADGLGSKTADANGVVSWTWRIGPRTSAGNWRITITGDGKTLNTYITVR